MKNKSGFRLPIYVAETHEFFQCLIDKSTAMVKVFPASCLAGGAALYPRPSRVPLLAVDRIKEARKLKIPSPSER